MKKGLTLTLLMAAMVAVFAASAFAVSPTINALPSVVIGDGDAADEVTSGLTLMRYNNVVDLTDPAVISWNNPTYTTDTFHVYLLGDAGNETNIVASNESALVRNITEGEYTALFGSAATQPPADADITSFTSTYDFFWLSLVDADINDAATTPMTDSYTNVGSGAAVPAGYEAMAQMTLVAGVTSGTTKMVADAQQFDVFSIQGAADATSVTKIVEVEASPASGNWLFVPSGAPYTAATQATTTNGVGFNVTANSGQTTVHGGWYRRDASGGLYTIVNGTEAGLAQPLIEVRANMASTAATTGATPQFIYKVLNAGGTHLLGQLYGPSDPVYMPSSGGNVDSVIYVAPPMNLTQMGDGEKISAASWIGSTDPSLGADGRDYQFIFELVQGAGATQAGILTLEQLTVTWVEAPAAGTGAVTWTGADAFTNWIAQAQEVDNLAPASSVGPNGTGSAMVFTMGTSSPVEGKFGKASPNPAQAEAFTTVASQPARIRATVQSSSPENCPNVIVYVQKIQVGTSGVTAQFGNQHWNIVGAVLGASGARAVRTGTEEAPGVLPSSPVMLDTYFAQAASLGGSNTYYVAPQFQVYSPGDFGPGTAGSAWGQMSGSVTVSGLTLEQVTID